MKSNLLWLILLGITFSGCAFIKNLKSLPVDYEPLTINRGAAQKSVELYYSGAAGFCIKYKGQSVLHDPFLTRISLFGQLKDQKNDSIKIAQYLDSTRLTPQTPPQLILGGHTHHDHMYDTPYIFYQLASKKGPYFMGTESMQDIMRHWDNKSFTKHHKHIWTFASVYSSSDTSETLPWCYLPDSSIRVLPIESTHAPHLCSWTFFKGKPKLEEEKSLSRASSWRTCNSLAYVIDFLGPEGEKELRIYIQSSSPDKGMGIPPASLEGFDIAILTTASFHLVEGHPEDLLKAIKPKLTIISHWETIFKELDKLAEKQKPLFSTDVMGFVNKVKEEVDDKAKEEGPRKWIMPNPGVRITYKF